ncbi:MAG TPA: DUF2950 domain-containing protein [Gemmatimonadaceae bacterium]|jgi:hypothetical protein|nr:DUF2950 domain-containing protein [Gemmatimonadaceae bacterium]
MSAGTLRIAGCLGAAAMLGILVGCGGSKDSDASNGSATPAVPAQQFASPEEAAAALVGAAEKYDVATLKSILGSNGQPIVQSGDSVSDRNDLIAFAGQAREKQHIDLDSAQTTAHLIVGPGEWPLPVPIVKNGDKWAFDAASGQQEILRRRIGRNELDAIQVCLGYVEAQHSYALVKHDGARVNQYAQRVISTPGKQDGLAWQAKDGTWQGPVGPRIAHAIEEGYATNPAPPYHGYVFKILKGQGPAAPMGQMDFVVDSAMIGGFALVAAPAEYLVTGVKTFIVSHDGIVYEKDLGEKTLEQFKAMDRYNPDSTWSRVQGN